MGQQVTVSGTTITASNIGTALRNQALATNSMSSSATRTATATRTLSSGGTPLSTTLTNSSVVSSTLPATGTATASMYTHTQGTVVPTRPTIPSATTVQRSNSPVVSNASSYLMANTSTSPVNVSTGGGVAVSPFNAGIPQKSAVAPTRSPVPTPQIPSATSTPVAPANGTVASVVSAASSASSVSSVVSKLPPARSIPTRIEPPKGPEKPMKEESKNALSAFLDRVSQLRQEVPDVAKVLEQFDEGSGIDSLAVSHTPKLGKVSDSIDDELNNLYSADSNIPANIRSSFFATDELLCDGMSHKKKKRKTEEGEVFSSDIGTMVQEVFRYSAGSTDFVAAQLDDSTPTTVVLQSCQKDSDELKLYLDMDSNPVFNMVPSVVLPVVSYSFEGAPKSRFPLYVDVSAQQRVKQKGYTNFLEDYRVYLKRKQVLEKEMKALAERGFLLKPKESGGVTYLWCCWAWNVPLPSIRIEIPPTYPQTSPLYYFEFQHDPSLQEAKIKFEQSLNDLGAPFSLTQLLNSWYWNFLCPYFLDSAGLEDPAKSNPQLMDVRAHALESMVNA